MRRSHSLNSNYASLIYFQDPEDPDFSGVVDFSNAVPGPDGSWCITKVAIELLGAFSTLFQAILRIHIDVTVDVFSLCAF